MHSQKQHEELLTFLTWESRQVNQDNMTENDSELTPQSYKQINQKTSGMGSKDPKISNSITFLRSADTDPRWSHLLVRNAQILLLTAMPASTATTKTSHRLIDSLFTDWSREIYWILLGESIALFWSRRDIKMWESPCSTFPDLSYLDQPTKFVSEYAGIAQ